MSSGSSIKSTAHTQSQAKHLLQVNDSSNRRLCLEVWLLSQLLTVLFDLIRLLHLSSETLCCLLFELHHSFGELSCTIRAPVKLGNRVCKFIRQHRHPACRWNAKMLDLLSINSDVASDSTGRPR